MKKLIRHKTKTQREKFEEAARELETDDSEEAFDAKLKKIAKARREDESMDSELFARSERANSKPSPKSGRIAMKSVTPNA